jgi:hypothetical protein
MHCANRRVICHSCHQELLLDVVDAVRVLEKTLRNELETVQYAKVVESNILVMVSYMMNGVVPSYNRIDKY